MFHYKWIAIRYFYKEQTDETFEVIFAFWQHLPYLNFTNANFLYTSTSFYNTNIGSAVITANNDCRLENFIDEITDETSLPATYHTFLNGEFSNEEFAYLRKSTFINFFIDNMIDVPICFKKSYSLKTKNFELPVLKFSNFLMKTGNREKLIRHLFLAMRNFYKNLKTDKIILNENIFKWLYFYLFSTNYLFRFNRDERVQWVLKSEQNLDLLYKHTSDSFDKNINVDLFIKNYVLSRFINMQPTFSYFIYSVDKNVRKFSRGKSGKYTFVWKYVAPYKRLYLTMKWAVKDIKFYQNKKFSERLIKTFTNLTLSPEKSFAWKSKIFSHNYVFKNFRKSLMTSLRTTL